MEFLKKHYEKVLMGVVLIGLAAGAAALPFMIGAERTELDQKSQEVLNPRIKALDPLNLKPIEELAVRGKAPVQLDLSTGNRVFNTMQWQQRPDGTRFKVMPGNTGPEAVKITNIGKLFTIITLDSVSAADTNSPAETGSRFVIGVERQAAAQPAQRRKKQYYSSLNVKNDTFVIREVKGATDNPTEIILELNDTNERVSLSKEKPFQRVDGFVADMKYDPEKKTWNGVRVGAGGPGTAQMTIAGESYIVVAINESEVVLSAKNSGKKTVITYKPGA